MASSAEGPAGDFNAQGQVRGSGAGPAVITSLSAIANGSYYSIAKIMARSKAKTGKNPTLAQATAIQNRDLLSLGYVLRPGGETAVKPAQTAKPAGIGSPSSPSPSANSASTGSSLGTGGTIGSGTTAASLASEPIVILAIGLALLFVVILASRKRR